MKLLSKLYNRIICYFKGHDYILSYVIVDDVYSQFQKILYDVYVCKRCKHRREVPTKPIISGCNIAKDCKECKHHYYDKSIFRHYCLRTNRELKIKK